MTELVIQVQPDDETCGPTSLHAIYGYYGLNIPLAEIIQNVERSLSGGTLSPMLGKHALEHGFQTKIYIYNLNIFDPSWFKKYEGNKEFLIKKLEEQIEFKKDIYITKESLAYIEYLKKGGIICFQSLNVNLLKKYFKKRVPILTALSATYLYRSMREFFTPEGRSVDDDIRGAPCGHFVVLCGYDARKRLVVVADPAPANPLGKLIFIKSVLIV